MLLIQCMIRYVFNLNTCVLPFFGVKCCLSYNVVCSCLDCNEDVFCGQRTEIIVSSV